ncbi:amidohydrolase family protein [Steroidobacter sp.]|uniref:amidohydrolase family protein n=1 Tax=Steroidobacter sp. TaxID=1978227 RepID=UPI001A38A31C|nr:amidohydrolase family protein [Steroidobacter sp.]MBL8265832.1 amidohydrolase family protein [Steroidobacter sp.]
MRSRIANALVATSFAIAGLHPTAQAARPRSLDASIAIEHVNLIPMTFDGLLKNQTLVIRDGRISDICDSEQQCTPAGARIIDGSGKYLIPALADMHNHLDGFAFDGKEETRQRTRRQMLRQYVMFGVAVVRDPANGPFVLKLRDAVNRGELLGPRIFAAPSIIEGSPPLFPGPRSFTSPEVASQYVRDAATRGFDLVKVYSTLSPPVFDAVMDAARDAGLTVAAHVPIDVPLDHALEKGLRSIEHLTGYDVACAAASVKMQPSRLDIYQGWAWCTPEKIRELAALTAKYRVWNVPTLSLWDQTVTDFDRPLRDAGEVGRYEHPATNRGLDWLYSLYGPRERAGITGTRSVRLALVKALSDAGAPLMVGSDISGPGYTIHREMAAFVEAGLTPYQALRAATAEPARYLQKEGDFGVLATGARADVLLLAANPLADIHNTRKIQGMMIQGRWWTQEQIQAELDAVLREYAEDAEAMRLSRQPSG